MKESKLNEFFLLVQFLKLCFR